jgi:hypothetical protein
VEEQSRATVADEGELREDPGSSSRRWRSRPARAAATGRGADQQEQQPPAEEQQAADARAARGGALEQQQPVEEKIRSYKEEVAVS